VRESFLLESFLSVHAVSEQALVGDIDRKKLLIPPGANEHGILPRVGFVDATDAVGENARAA